MEFTQKTDEEILSIAVPIMDNLMDASTAVDHERHVRDFTERAKAIVTKEHFQKVCAQYQSEKGFFARREFVTIFRRPQSVVVLWKQGFTKQSGEFVAQMLLVENEGRYLVDHVMVF